MKCTQHALSNLENTHPTLRDNKAICRVQPTTDHFVKMDFGWFMVTTVKSRMSLSARRLYLLTTITIQIGHGVDCDSGQVLKMQLPLFSKHVIHQHWEEREVHPLQTPIMCSWLCYKPIPLWIYISKMQHQMMMRWPNFSTMIRLLNDCTHLYVLPTCHDNVAWSICMVNHRGRHFPSDMRNI